MRVSTRAPPSSGGWGVKWVVFWNSDWNVTHTFVPDGEEPRNEQKAGAGLIHS